MTGTFAWQGRPVRFRDGESVASALDRAGIRAFGSSRSGQSHAVFCGIGQCQGCLVLHQGRPTEACLLPAQDGMSLGGTGQEETGWRETERRETEECETEECEMEGCETGRGETGRGETGRGDADG